MSGFAHGFGAEIRRIGATRVDLFLLTAMPLLLLAAMAAMIFAGSPRGLKTVIVDHDGGVLARAITRDIAASPDLRIVAETPDLGAAMAMIRREDAVAAVVIPHGVGTRVAQGAPVEIFHQALFLSTGALAATHLRVAVLAALAQAAPDQAGLRGVAATRLPLPGVTVTLLGNPTFSLEWYLGLLLGPGVLHLLIAVTAVSSVGALMRERSFARYVTASAAPGTALAGRLAVHVVAGSIWGTLWLLWLTLARGYRVEGSLLLIVLGLILLFAATVSVALLLVAATRTVSTSLSGAVILAGSALAYSGASLPLAGASLFARVWSAILPLTHYVTLQMDQVLGVAPAPMLHAAGALLLYPIVAGGAGLGLMLRDRVTAEAAPGAGARP
ncbi:ABC transporter permease [Sphingomonadaceae bacterium jetA1]|jgi:ABC-2 type transport system permease protein|uniref:ABC transporter permease n=1 Tax=Facivitalis istanbulensis TaxID=3075838 RepID=UPI00347019F0